MEKGGQELRVRKVLPLKNLLMMMNTKRKINIMEAEASVEVEVDQVQEMGKR